MILGLAVVVLLAEQMLERLNRRHLELHGLEIPEGFAGVVDAALLAKTREYTLAKMEFSTWVNLANAAGLLVFFFTPVWDLCNTLILSWKLPAWLQGSVYFVVLASAASLLSLPFSWYQTFKLEARFGFNTQTFGLWITDALKALLLSAVLLGLLSAGGLWLVARFPQTWWLWVWSFFFGFSLFLMVISPYVLEPLFNKFKPVDRPELTKAISALLARAGIRVSRVFESDASRRSRHTNAYFSGIGPVKRIVLFDTLLEKNTVPELLAVLAHEAGHWKKKHLFKTLAWMESLALAGFYVAHQVLQAPWISRIFGLGHPSFLADVIGLLFVASLLGFFLEPAVNYLSRQHEREADGFAAELTGEPQALAAALISLVKDNLSNLHPHPWYAAFHFSHPPLVERVRRLQSLPIRRQR
ncbi:MAG: M48 family metallopeptidase [Candidatus Firestonebacteria bacterium]|nr:M48 family metallopeptidase [Candidatus Firestonebacteria bacterium]